MGPQLPLFLTACIVLCGSTLAASNNKTLDQAVSSRVKNEGELPENFRNLFSSIAKSNIGQSEALRDALKDDIIREQRAFNSIREELLTARRKNSLSMTRRSEERNNLTRNNFMRAKLETHDREPVLPNAAEETTLHSAAEPQDTTLYSSTNVPEETTPLSTVVTEKTTFHTTVHPDKLISKIGTGKQSDGKLSPPSQPEEPPCLKTNEESQSSPLPFIPGPGQSFYKVKTQKDRNYVIVDKTDFIRRLIDNDDIPDAHKVYFLSRPKTFGKTFFLSMLREFLDGKKGLFTGTAIASRGNAMKEDGKWGQRPVISIDFSAISARTVEDFWDKLREKLNAIAERYGIRTENGVNGVGKLIRALKSKFDFPVSILIDEFDSPVIFAPNKRVQEGIEKELALFYLEISSAAFESELWLVLIMGVNRLNIFGETMNGIVNDITFDEKFSSILGFSRKETEEAFKSHLDSFAVESKWNSSADAAVKVEERYGGYRFSEKGGDAVLDAGSVCSCLRKFKLADFETKTKALVNIRKRMIKERKGIDFFKRFCIRSTDLIAKYNTDEGDSVPLYMEMLCNGYLTILKRRRDPLDLCLTYPNEGIQGLIERVLPAELRSRKEDANQTLNELYRSSLKELLQDSLNEGNMKIFVQELISLAFPIVTSSLRFQVQDKDKEFLATGYMYRTLKAVGLDCEEGRTLDRNDGNPGGDLDLIIYASEKHTPHYAISVKFKNNSPQQAIFQLFHYILIDTEAFERIFDNRIETDVINLVALVVKNDAQRQRTISAWILVPYTRREKRIWISKTECSPGPSIKQSMSKDLENQAFYKGNKKNFV